MYIFLKIQVPGSRSHTFPNNDLDITQFITIFSFPVPLSLLLPRIISQMQIISCLIRGNGSKTKAFPRTEDQILLLQTNMSLHNMAGEGVRKARLEPSGYDSPVFLLGSHCQMVSWHQKCTRLTDWSWRALQLHLQLLVPAHLVLLCGHKARTPYSTNEERSLVLKSSVCDSVDISGPASVSTSRREDNNSTFTKLL